MHSIRCVCFTYLLNFAKIMMPFYSFYYRKVPSSKFLTGREAIHILYLYPASFIMKGNLSWKQTGSLTWVSCTLVTSDLLPIAFHKDARVSLEETDSLQRSAVSQWLQAPAPLLLFSHTVLSDSLRPHKLEHARPPCPSPSPWVCPSSCSWHQWWCCPAISSSDALFLLPPIFPGIRDLPALLLIKPSSRYQDGVPSRWMSRQ